MNSNDDSLLSGAAAAAMLRRPLVAVLPFAAAGNDASLALLGSEVADLLRERLAAVPDLRTILISSDFLQRAPDYALDLICRQLRIGHLVSGRCHRTPRGAALYVELSETREGKLVWARFLRSDARELLAPDSATLSGLQQDLAATLKLLAARRRMDAPFPPIAG